MALGVHPLRLIEANRDTAVFASLHISAVQIAAEYMKLHIKQVRVIKSKYKNKIYKYVCMTGAFEV